MEAPQAPPPSDRLKRHPPASTARHLALMMRKNYWLKRRKPMGTCCEIMLPVVVTLLLVLGWLASSNKDYLDTTFTPGTILDSISEFQNKSCVDDASIKFNPPLKVCNGINYNTKILNVSGRLTIDSAVPSTPFSLDMAIFKQKLFDSWSISEDPRPSAIVFTPGNHPDTKKLIEYLNTTYGFFKYTAYTSPNGKPRTFASDDEVSSCLEDGECEGRVWATVNIQDFSSTTKQYKYTIRMNSSIVPETSSVDNRFEQGGLDGSQFTFYQNSGFLSLQRAIDEYILKELGTSSPDVLTAIMPTKGYTEYTFLARSGGLLPTVMTFAFLYFVSTLVKLVVEEKEMRIREAMLIMGLKKSTLYSSWFLTYLIESFLGSTALTILLVSTMFDHTSALMVFIFVYAFVMSLVGLSFAIAACFSKAKLAAMLAPLIVVIMTIPTPMVSEKSKSVQRVFCVFFSPSTFQNTMKLFASYESTGTGATLDHWGHDELSFSDLYGFLWLNNIIYFLLALYLDNVIPSEFGVPLHPLFFLMPSWWKEFLSKEDTTTLATEDEMRSGLRSRTTSVIDASGFKNISEGSLVEDVRHEKAPTVTLRDLRRVFSTPSGQMVAVDDLNLQFYEGQIQVLLGHNGAGKTTTINMLTGMIPLTSGNGMVYGKSVTTQMSSIRQDLGFCPQHNILWKGISVEEHLMFFAGLKGVPEGEMMSVVSDMLRSVSLMDKRQSYANTLSGGQKRKLSVAIALIGGSRLVFLDEPTAGMDVEARHSMWEILRTCSVGRTVVLTTHYMDEADLLGNSIAIMHKGRLNCWGSPMFLKSKLGVGYNLSLAVSPQVDADSVLSMIRKHIPDANNVSKATGELQYCLPMSTTDQFPDLFRQLEVEGRAMGVTSFGISITTMEEVFLRIAMQESDNVIEEGEAGQPDSPKSKEDPLLQKAGASAFAIAPEERSAGNALIVRQLYGLFVKRMHVARRDRRSLFCNLVVPVVVLALAMLLKNIGGPPEPYLLLSPDMYSKPLSSPAFDCSAIQSKAFSPGYNIEVFPTTNMPLNETSQYLLSKAWAHGGYDRANAFGCATPSLGKDLRLVWHNASKYHSLPAGINAMHSMIASIAGGRIFTASHPFPRTKDEQKLMSEIQSMLIALFVLIPFCLIPANYVGFLVKEREVKAKHVQIVSGVHPLAYWFSSYAFDFLTFIVTACLSLLVFAIFDRQEYVAPGETSAATTLSLLLFGLSSTALVYATNFMFKNHSSAQNITMMMNLVCGFFLVIASFILDMVDSTKDTNSKLKYVYRFVPSYCLGEIIMRLATLPLRARFDNAAKPLSMDCAGTGLLYMAIETPIFLGITILMDASWWQVARAKVQTNAEDGNDTPPTDDDVLAEVAAVDRTGGRDGDLLTVQHLRKVYPPSGNARVPKIAVRDISFGVRRAEIFGFLGTNGAGKTTTMSILSGEFPPSSGAGYLCGYNVVTELSKAQQNLGYCPQFDALLDLMTPREHLYMYARLRGIPEERIAGGVEALIRKLDLQKHAHKLSKDLSGGNKRKLSIAIAMIGGPTVLFLDEPSAGMDPVARRGLWDALQDMSEGRSVVLTTHHLEEVEALCHRVAIMVDGNLRCIGSLQHLKDKFGTGYDLDVKVFSEEQCAKCQTFVLDNLKGSMLDEVHGTRLSFKVAREEAKLSSIFELIQAHAPELGVRDFSLSQTTLESVFMRLSQNTLEQDAKQMEEATLERESIVVDEL